MTSQAVPQIQLRDGQQSRDFDSGDGIQLPFPVDYLWWKNGEVAFKQISQARYYGGWFTDYVSTLEVCESLGTTIPDGKGWEQVTLAFQREDRTDEELHLANRVILVAPIAQRESWFNGNTKQRSPDYQAGSRRHVQVLSYMFVKRADDVVVPWGLVVLSSKGYNGSNLTGAIRDWHKLALPSLRKIAPGVSPKYFMMGLGTFGKDRSVKQVGKGDNKSPISPIAHWNAEPSPELMGSLFVGHEVVDLMNQAEDEGEEWLNAWNTPSEDAGFGVSNGSAEGEVYNGGEVEGDGIPW